VLCHRAPRFHASSVDRPRHRENCPRGGVLADLSRTRHVQVTAFLKPKLPGQATRSLDHRRRTSMEPVKLEHKFASHAPDAGGHVKHRFPARLRARAASRSCVRCALPRAQPSRLPA
jgi:hypothetical protein